MNIKKKTFLLCVLSFVGAFFVMQQLSDRERAAAVDPNPWPPPLPAETSPFLTHNYTVSDANGLKFDLTMDPIAPASNHYAGRNFTVTIHVVTKPGATSKNLIVTPIPGTRSNLLQSGSLTITPNVPLIQLVYVCPGHGSGEDRDVPLPDQIKFNTIGGDLITEPFYCIDAQPSVSPVSDNLQVHQLGTENVISFDLLGDNQMNAVPPTTPDPIHNPTPDISHVTSYLLFGTATPPPPPPSEPFGFLNNSLVHPYPSSVFGRLDPTGQVALFGNVDNVISGLTVVGSHVEVHVNKDWGGGSGGFLVDGTTYSYAIIPTYSQLPSNGVHREGANGAWADQVSVTYDASNTDIPGTIHLQNFTLSGTADGNTNINSPIILPASPGVVTVTFQYSVTDPDAADQSLNFTNLHLDIPPSWHFAGGAVNATRTPNNGPSGTITLTIDKADNPTGGSIAITGFDSHNPLNPGGQPGHPVSAIQNVTFDFGGGRRRAPIACDSNQCLDIGKQLQDLKDRIHYELQQPSLYPLNTPNYPRASKFASLERPTFKEIVDRLTSANNFFSIVGVFFQSIDTLSQNECFTESQCFQKECYPCHIDTYILDQIKAKLVVAEKNLRQIKAEKDHPALRPASERIDAKATLNSYDKMTDLQLAQAQSQVHFNHTDSGLYLRAKDAQKAVDDLDAQVKKETDVISQLGSSCQRNATSVHADLCEQPKVPPDTAQCRVCADSLAQAEMLYNGDYTEKANYMKATYKHPSDTNTPGYKNDLKELQDLKAKIEKLLGDYNQCLTSKRLNVSCPIPDNFPDLYDQCHDLCAPFVRSFKSSLTNVCKDYEESDSDKQKQIRDLGSKIQTLENQIANFQSRLDQLNQAGVQKTIDDANTTIENLIREINQEQDNIPKPLTGPKPKSAAVLTKEAQVQQLRNKTDSLPSPNLLSKNIDDAKNQKMDLENQKQDLEKNKTRRDTENNYEKDRQEVELCRAAPLQCGGDPTKTVTELCDNPGGLGPTPPPPPPGDGSPPPPPPGGGDNPPVIPPNLITLLGPFIKNLLHPPSVNIPGDITNPVTGCDPSTSSCPPNGVVGVLPNPPVGVSATGIPNAVIPDNVCIGACSTNVPPGIPPTANGGDHGAATTDTTTVTPPAEPPFQDFRTQICGSDVAADFCKDPILKSLIGGFAQQELLEAVLNSSTAVTMDFIDPDKKFSGLVNASHDIATYMDAALLSSLTCDDLYQYKNVLNQLKGNATVNQDMLTLELQGLEKEISSHKCTADTNVKIVKDSIKNIDVSVLKEFSVWQEIFKQLQNGTLQVNGMTVLTPDQISQNPNTPIAQAQMSYDIAQEVFREYADWLQKVNSTAKGIEALKNIQSYHAAVAAGDLPLPGAPPALHNLLSGQQMKDWPKKDDYLKKYRDISSKATASNITCPDIIPFSGLVNFLVKAYAQLQQATNNKGYAKEVVQDFLNELVNQNKLSSEQAKTFSDQVNQSIDSASTPTTPAPVKP